MEKLQAVTSLWRESTHWASLARPTRLRNALKANDRLKLYLTVLQASAAHAHAPSVAPIDLSREIAAADVTVRDEIDWLHDLPATASLEDSGAIHLPDLPRIARKMSEDLATMFMPLVDGEPENTELVSRARAWCESLVQVEGEIISPSLLASWTHGQRADGDSFHLTVMDLHKALNRLAAKVATERIAGAHTWQLAGDGSDAPRIESFMRGVERTRALKGDHPGLETSATRDGGKLLIQNDIGTNDAHVLVIQVDTGVEPMATTLTYSDLHGQRFAFFQRQLSALGAQWSQVETRQSDALNGGEAFHVGTARFVAPDDATLKTQLEGIGERIVFLIDWNRARKRLLPFVDKLGAVSVLESAAEQRAGHMAWLSAGGDKLIWGAMAAQGAGTFRLGDRLDEVLGEESARDFLAESMALAARAALSKLPMALVADEVRALLGRYLQGRQGDLDLLEEHAALCQALAESLRDAWAHGLYADAAAAVRLASRAKGWERQADQLVMRARSMAERQPHWAPTVSLIQLGDDVADALEEAFFVLSMLAEHTSELKSPHAHWPERAIKAIGALAEAVLVATQDHVKALSIARALRSGGLTEASDSDTDREEFLAACWRVLQAERQCDELLRSARRALAAACREHSDTVAYTLGTELAEALELASDSLLAFGYGLRDRVFLQWQEAAA